VGEDTVVVAGSLDDVEESGATLVRGLAIGIPLSTAVLAGIVWWAVGRALRPVDDIRARVDEISGSRLDRRVPETGSADEIARLARTMNAMLARLQQSAERQRAFVADASHELRSPLARMRAEMEVDAAHPETADAAATAASVLAETVTLQRLVDDLLLLARGDAGALEVVPGEPVDLDEVVQERVAVLRAAGEQRIDAGGVRPAQVRGDPGQLRRAVANLLDNAVRHARDRIVVTLDERPNGGVELTVADDGPGVPPADRDRIFERFTRLDDARSAQDGGAGLGLAIARDIAVRHGGTVAVDGPPGARFVLLLPGERSMPSPPTVRR
jgi:signal transduction histidine kinase